MNSSHDKSTATRPEIHAYMPTNNGGRQRAFDVDGVRILVGAHEDDERGKSVAEFLADAPTVVESLRAEVQRLRTEVQRLRTEVPPREPVRLLGPGCVRFRDGKLWLLNNAADGWAAFGLQLASWDDLFRRFNASVVGHGSDAFGDFWEVR
jgi:hypothetical protein